MSKMTSYLRIWELVTTRSNGALVMESRKDSDLLSFSIRAAMVNVLEPAVPEEMKRFAQADELDKVIYEFMRKMAWKTVEYRGSDRPILVRHENDGGRIWIAPGDLNMREDKLPEPLRVLAQRFASSIYQTEHKRALDRRHRCRRDTDLTERDQHDQVAQTYDELTKLVADATAAWLHMMLVPHVAYGGVSLGGIRGFEAVMPKLKRSA